MKRIAIIRIIFTILVVLVLLGNHLFSATVIKDYTYFYKGLAYYFLKDASQAEQNLGMFFKLFPDPSLKGAFFNLVRKNSNEVTKEFNRYLDINHRSHIALTGLALSVSDLKAPGAIDNFERAQRLEETFSAAYLCLGIEYQKLKNYPRAEQYFNLAFRYAKIPEYKILMARLFLRKNAPEQVINLLKQEAELQPDNFYYNFYTARAYYRMGRIDEMARFIQTAAEMGPDNPDAQMLFAKFLTRKGRSTDAINILKKLKFKEYNEEYYKTYAMAFFDLKDKKAKSFMDTVYLKNPWNKDINRLLGQYYQWKKTEKGNIQNWINRALISGNTPDELRRLFPGAYHFPVYNSMGFFQLKAMTWVSNNILAVGAIRSSGESGKLFFLQASDLKVLSTLDYKGVLKEIHRSPDGSKLIFLTDSGLNEKSYIYAVDVVGNNFSLSLLTPQPITMPSMSVGFRGGASLVFITDRRLAGLMSGSPFAWFDETGEKHPVLKSFPFLLIMYNFNTRQISTIKDVNYFSKIPIDSVKKYYRVTDATASKSDIQNLLEKGQTLDLTSSEVVKIFFSDDISSFIIYLSDLKNACQGILYESNNNSITKVDEFKFLPQYAELKFINLDPEKKEIIVLTKDNARRMVKYNYSNYTYITLTDKVYKYYFDRAQNRIFALTERSKKQSFTETNLEIIYLDPYFKKVIDTRRDLNKILFVSPEDSVYFSTLAGECVKMDDNYKFYYAGPSLEGGRAVMSPDFKRTAAFIDNRLIIINGPVYQAPRKSKISVQPKTK